MRLTELCEKIDEAEQLLVAADLPYMLRLLDGVARASLSGLEEDVDDASTTEADRNELVSHPLVSWPKISRSCNAVRSAKN